MHKARADTNLTESGWVGSREELPQPQFTWQPAGGGDAGAVGLHKWRKVR